MSKIHWRQYDSTDTEDDILKQEMHTQATAMSNDRKGGMQSEETEDRVDAWMTGPLSSHSAKCFPRLGSERFSGAREKKLHLLSSPLA
jgi:hypothetical protein